MNHACAGGDAGSRSLSASSTCGKCSYEPSQGRSESMQWTLCLTQRRRSPPRRRSPLRRGWGQGVFGWLQRNSAKASIRPSFGMTLHSTAPHCPFHTRRSQASRPSPVPAATLGARPAPVMVSDDGWPQHALWNPQCHLGGASMVSPPPALRAAPSPLRPGHFQGHLPPVLDAGALKNALHNALRAQYAVPFHAPNHRSEAPNHRSDQGDRMTGSHRRGRRACLRGRKHSHRRLRAQMAT
jgi:hypothetical protein